MEKEEKQTIAVTPAQRLCSEIQLFDLCDLETCIYKEGRFCRQEQLLARFERIADVEDTTPVRRLSDELEEDEDADELGFAEYDSAEDDEFGQRDDDWED